MSEPKNKRVIIVVGPTAVGKTTVAITLAEHFKTAIISADSRQCYRELNIGVARPSDEELARVRHYFIASHSITDEVTAAGFEKFALDKTNELFKEHDTVIMTGGTGLYIKAFCEGLDDIPTIKEDVRRRITENYEDNGLEWLQQEIKQKDPEFFAVGEIKNPRRLMRALEVIESTGISILQFRKGNKVSRPFEIIKWGLSIPKEQLHHNIHTRVDNMISRGLVGEVSSLLPFRHLNALQTVGYTEIFEHLDGRLTLEEAVAAIKTNTRQYAKRQLTWFRKDKGIEWMGQGSVVREVDRLIGR